MKSDKIKYHINSEAALVYLTFNVLGLAACMGILMESAQRQLCADCSLQLATTGYWLMLPACFSYYFFNSFKFHK